MADVNASTTPKLLWDIGTAYDLFTSVWVLHEPAKFGLRGAWAAGVRSRLSADDREILEKMFQHKGEPMAWVHQLPEPKDATTVLYALKQMPPEERLTNMFLSTSSSDYVQLLRSVAERGEWDENDRLAIAQIMEGWKHTTSSKKIEGLLDLWAKAAEFGEKYFQALQSYQEVFFAEEEKRIRPALEKALDNAQKLAEEVSFNDLLEELSRGITFEESFDVEEIVFVPSFWNSPLITFEKVSDERMLFLFGARSPEDSLVPGEIVPDDLLLALKALADPTRLRILRFLTMERMTPAELSRRLRLRAPTVTHHLHALRLAGLVRFSLKGKNERLYAARPEAVTSTYAALKSYMATDAAEDVESVSVFERGRIW
jgi:DNA-binding transcriptional ArsR family regulator